jgi:outer membrane lipoprotein-sorting protein
MRGPGLVRRGAAFAVAATLCFLSAVVSRAQDVPTPPPRPKAPLTTQTTPSTPDTAAATTPAATASTAPEKRGFFPFSALGRSLGVPQATAFDAKQRALLDKVSNYLSSVQTLVGNFVQIGPDGRRVEGTFSIQKPGKVRFQYNPPSPIDIVADGSSVVVYDRALETSDYYPLSQTPLRYLLADRIDLLRDTDVVSVSADDTFITVVIEETQLVVGTNRLMMMFDAKNLQLKQWTVTDPQGLDTTVAVYNLDPAKKPDPNLFVINYSANMK